jgi:integral membrane sensor domain MASE1
MEDRSSSKLRTVGAAILAPLVVAVAYIVAARFGFTFASATKQVTAIWPPTGIAVAALLLYGYRVWPGIWMGAFISNVFSAEPVFTAGAIATGNTLAPVFGRFLLQRFGFDNALNRVRDVLLLALLASAVAMTVSASNGVIDLAFARIVPWDAFASVWWVWWTGDAMGVLLVAPLLLTWIASRGLGVRIDGRRLESVVLGAALVAASWLSFLSSLPIRVSIYPLIIWSALRFRQRETTTAIAIVAGIAIWATTHNLGPWISGSLDLRLIQLDSWMSIFAFTGLVLGAATAEKRAARAALGAALAQTKHSIETLEGAFLPVSLPHRSGLQCDALYIPAEREGLIGGDWYDAFELPDRRIVFSIGDVAGHGIEAAVAGARIRRSIFAAAFASADPADILATVGRSQEIWLETPATAIVAIISADLSVLHYASAGHPPPIVAGPNIAAHLLEFGGVPFGVGVPVAASTYTVALERGAVIVFYTDGLTEFERNIDLAESRALEAVSLLVRNSKIERPAEFVQRSVMGTQRPADDTVLLLARVD